MEYSYEIIEALYEKYNEDRDNIFLLTGILKELYLTTDCFDFKNELKKICENYNICPVCMKGLIVDDYKGNKICEECGAEF